MALLAISFTVQAGGIDPQDISVSPDITLLHFGEPLTDEDATLPGDPSKRLDFGMLPAGVEVAGFHLDQENELIYFAVDQMVKLGGKVFTPQDVILTDGSDYEIFYEGRSEGVPRSVKIDAVAVIDGELFLSFDTTVKLNEVAADEDLVWASNGHVIYFDGSAEGVPPELNLDGAYLFDDSNFAFSFDTHAKLGSVIVSDEDIVLFENGSFSTLLYDGSSINSEWQSGDLNGLSIGSSSPPPPPPVGLIFEDDFESADTSAWTATVGGS